LTELDATNFGLNSGLPAFTEPYRRSATHCRHGRRRRPELTQNAAIPRANAARDCRTTALNRRLGQLSRSRSPYPQGRLHKLSPHLPIVPEHRHPGIDDLQSSSSAGATGGGVECNSTIPGSALQGLHPSLARRSPPHDRHQRSVGIPMQRSPVGRYSHANRVGRHSHANISRRSASPCRPGCTQGTRSGGLR
jgi:hypothetical protein